MKEKNPKKTNKKPKEIEELASDILNHDDIPDDIPEDLPEVLETPEEIAQKHKAIPGEEKEEVKKHISM